MKVEAPEELISEVLNAGFEVHKELGPGLLESVYTNALCVELGLRGIKTQCEVPVSVSYKGHDCGIGFRADILVENVLLIEMKAVEKLIDVHVAQVLTYLRFLNMKRGLLLDFGERLLKDGIKRVSN